MKLMFDSDIGWNQSGDVNRILCDIVGVSFGRQFHYTSYHRSINSLATMCVLIEVRRKTLWRRVNAMWRRSERDRGQTENINCISGIHSIHNRFGCRTYQYNRSYRSKTLNNKDISWSSAQEQRIQNAESGSIFFVHDGLQKKWRATSQSHFKYGM